MSERLYRSRDDRMIAGVAGGLADRLNVDPSLVRILWAILVLPTGLFALLVYVIMAIVVPDEDDLYRPGTFGAPFRADPPAGVGAAAFAPPGPEAATVPPGSPPPFPVSPPPTRDQWRAQRRDERLARRGPRRSGSASLVIGGALILVGAWFLIREYVPAIEPERFWPIALVGLGALLLVLALGRRSGESGEGPG